MTSTTSLLVFALAILSSANTILGADNDTVTTTIAPTTAFASNDTTTATPSTTAAPTSTMPPSSTTVPSTTTKAASTTTKVPSTTAPPHPKDDMWIVKDPKTGVICMVAEMKIQLDIPYTNVSNKVVKTLVEVPGNATGFGTCDSSKLSEPQTLVLQWGQPNATSNVTLVFASNTTSKQFWLQSISADIAVDNKTFPRIRPTIKVVKLVNGTKHFVTPMNNSYSCATKLNIPGQLDPAVVNQTGYFTLDHFQLEAFKNSTSNGFSSAIYCEGDNTPDLVPILVGCTLVGLVVIVLGVYLWGRRRSQQRGYLSMLGQSNN